MKITSIMCNRGRMEYMLENLPNKFSTVRECSPNEWVGIPSKILQIEGEYIDARHTKFELEEFINRMNFDIQYLGLNKEEVIDLVSQLFR